MWNHTTEHPLTFLFSFVFLVLSAHAQDATSFVSPGPLAEAHEHLTGLSGCTNCHTLGVGVDARKCLDCHDEIQAQVANKTGFHADKAASCHSCHPDHRGRAFDMVGLDESTFDHRETGFALEGAHGRAECTDCHEEGAWSGLDPTCNGCHDDPHGSEQSTRDLASCESCHGVLNWDAFPLALSIFDHTKAGQADFVLAGEHVEVACTACHPDWRFVPIEAEACIDCHEDLHSGQFAPRVCEDCHTVDVPAFALRDWDHDRTDYPLRGSHKRVRCESCHGDGARARYVDLPHERCETCHDDPHEGQFAPRDCDACHTLASFELPDIDHDQTNFPLVGEHRNVGCGDCHGEGEDAVFAGLPFGDCATCHDDMHDGRFAPDRCDSCHTDGSWLVEGFDHGRTAFALTGKHATTACDSCHIVDDAQVWTPLQFGTCLDCHDDDDPHGGHFAGEACTDCHVTDGWLQVAFAHLEQTGFPLADAHDLPCAECHAEPTYSQADPTCESCHAEDEPDDHFEGACVECHTPTTWQGGTLGEGGHDATGFPLRGAHALAACAECHEPGLPMHAASPMCNSCHGSDDPHRNLISNQCQDCHGPIDWTRVSFRHAVTGFPLRGVHRMAPCRECHPARFAGTPRACIRCHRYERPNDTFHRTQGNSPCDACHRPYDWEAVRIRNHPRSQ